LQTSAIVTNDVAPYSIVGGVPAKFIKMRFEESQIIILRKFKWWTKDFNWIKENYSSFSDIELFLHLIKLDFKDLTQNLV